MKDIKKAKDARRITAAGLLIIGSLAATAGLAYLGTTAAWGYPASIARPLVGAAIGAFLTIAACYLLTGRLSEAGEALHRAAALAGVIFLGYGFGAMARGSRDILNAVAFSAGLLAFMLVVSWLWRARRKSSRPQVRRSSPAEARRRRGNDGEQNRDLDR